MGVWDFDSLASHLGHCIEVVCYGGTDGPNRNVAVECTTCGEVLLDFDEYPEEEEEAEPGELEKALQECIVELALAIGNTHHPTVVKFREALEHAGKANREALDFAAQEVDRLTSEETRLLEALSGARSIISQLEARVARRDSELATVRDWAHKLQARVNELRQEIEREKAEAFKLAAGVCIVEGGLVGDEGGTPYCTVQRELAQAKLQLQEQEACTSWTNDFRVEAEKRIAQLEAERREIIEATKADIDVTERLLAKIESLEADVETWKRRYAEKIYHNE
jgi:chromosome segregation ATPase